LIIEADGAVVPVEYSFGREFELGNLQDATLPVLAARWKLEKQSAFRQLCREVYASATANTEPAVINWYELIAQKSAADNTL
jgi:Fe-coproporphyrin III synthase